MSTWDSEIDKQETAPVPIVQPVNPDPTDDDTFFLEADEESGDIVEVHWRHGHILRRLHADVLTSSRMGAWVEYKGFKIQVERTPDPGIFILDLNGRHIRDIVNPKHLFLTVLGRFSGG